MNPITTAFILSLSLFWIPIAHTQGQSSTLTQQFCSFINNFSDTVIKFEKGIHAGGYEMSSSVASRDQIAFIHDPTARDSFMDMGLILPSSVPKLIRVGDREAGRNAALVRYKGFSFFDTLVIYYRLVSDEPGAHDEGEGPYFAIRLMDEYRVPLACEKSIIRLHEGMPGVRKSLSGHLYTDWKTLYLDMRTYFGKKIIIEFEAGDCSLGQHLAYGYVYFGCLNASGLPNNLKRNSINIITTDSVIATCPGSPVTAIAKEGFDSYLWSNGKTTRSITVKEPGIYKVWASSKNFFCPIEDQFVYYPPMQYAKIQPNSYCHKNGLLFSIKGHNFNNGDSITRIEWDYGNDGIFEKTGVYFDTSYIEKPFTLAARITTKKGCVFTITEPITPIELDDIAYPIIKEYHRNTCAGSPVRFKAFETYARVDWDFMNDGSFEVSNAYEAYYTFPSPGIYPVRMRSFFRSGCFRDTVWQIKISEPAQPDFTWDKSSICQGDVVQFSARFQKNPVQIDWDLDGDGYYETTNVSKDFKPSMRFLVWGKQNIGLRAYTYKPYSNDDEACVDTIIKSIEIHPLPVAEIKGDIHVCSGDAVSVYWVESPVKLASIKWKPENGWVKRQSGDTVWVSWLSGKKFYMLEADAVSVHNCRYTVSLSEIFKWDVAPTPMPQGESRLCRDDAVRWYFIPKQFGHTYQWNVENGTILNGQNSDSVLVCWNVSGKGRLWLERSHTLDSVCFEKSPILEVDIFPAKDTVVEIVQVSHENGTGLDILWRTEGETRQGQTYILRNGMDLANRPKIDGVYTDTDAQIDSRNYDYQIYTQNRCGVRVSSLSHRNILLRASFSEEEKTVFLSWNRYINWPKGVERYEVWRRLDDNPAELIQTTSDTSLTLTDGTAGFLHCYQVIARSEDGRISRSNQSCVRFEHKVTYNELLTPNGDGLNDKLVIDRLERYPQNRLRIFNRYGQQIWAKTGYDNSWEASGLEGTYFLIFEYVHDGTHKSISGAVTVLR